MDGEIDGFYSRVRRSEICKSTAEFEMPRRIMRARRAE